MFTPNQRVSYEDRTGQRHVGNLVGCDEKNGRTVYDIETDNGEEFWGYEDQFTAIN